MKQIIVTVGREHGSGGKYIAEQIAKQLGIAFYDKELLLASVFNAEDAARYDEKPVHLLWSRRIGENFNAPEDALAHETFEHIQELADSGESFVVLGRCSDYVLRSNPNAVHLFIAGKPDVKRRRLMEEKSLTADQAAQEMRRVDRDRKAYHNYYCDTKWGDARGYDLVVNSGKSFVVLGRCSDYVLRANPNAVHLFIAGKPDQKRQRLMKEKSLTADQAALEIRRIDRDRKAYHNYYCDTKWGDARGYDLVVNSGKLGVEKTVDTLVTYVRAYQAQNE